MTHHRSALLLKEVMPTDPMRVQQFHDRANFSDTENKSPFINGISEKDLGFATFGSARCSCTINILDGTCTAAGTACVFFRMVSLRPVFTQ
jgi:hypothetical protein